MRIEPYLLKVGRTYIGKPGSYPRKIVQLGYWWNRNYHGLVYYIGKSGRTVETSDKSFCAWVERVQP